MTETTHPIRVLAIIGSPRKNGNTETLVDTVLAGAAEAGARTEKVLLRPGQDGLEIRPCLACDACQRTGACAQKDDMAALLVKMQESQVWVLGTPVYWWGPTAQFKAFLDRWYGAERKAVFAGKRVILTIPFEDTYAAAPRHTVGILTESLNYVGAEVVSTILAPGVHRPGEVSQRPDLIELARKAGREVVED
jgi:NAD(P)H-dependent FMN reductase